MTTKISCCLLVIAFFLATTDVSAASRDLWLIDARTASWTRADEVQFEKLTYRQQTDQGWVRSDAATFFETQDPEKPMIVFAPGYTTTYEEIIDIGMQLIRLNRKQAPARVVFWYWPAAKVQTRLVPDIRAKIPVAAANGRYMAMMLRRLKPNSKVCAIGFSFGNRVICDAVETLGDDRPEGMRLHLVLAGAATDYGSMTPRGKHANIPRLAEKILVLYNPDDFRLHFYPYLYGPHCRPEALGTHGPPLRQIAPEYRDRFESVNLQPYIGCRHTTKLHLASPPFRSRVCSYVLFEGCQDDVCP